MIACSCAKSLYPACTPHHSWSRVDHLKTSFRVIWSKIKDDLLHHISTPAPTRWKVRDRKTRFDGWSQSQSSFVVRFTIPEVWIRIGTEGGLVGPAFNSGYFIPRKGCPTWYAKYIFCLMSFKAGCNRRMWIVKSSNSASLKFVYLNLCVVLVTVIILSMSLKTSKSGHWWRGKSHQVHMAPPSPLSYFSALSLSL